MFAVIEKSVTYTDDFGKQYYKVAALSEVAEGWHENYFAYKDLAKYENGSNVQVGWWYYIDDDKFAAPFVYHYYAILNEVNIAIDIIKTLEVYNKPNYILIDDIRNISEGMAYINGTFMSLDEANYRMLLKANLM